MPVKKIKKTILITTSNKPALFGIITLIIIVIVVTGFFFFKSNSPKNQKSTASNSLIQNVGKLIALPSETPKIATVTDKKKVNDRPFFAKSENGDKVLIFSESKKAILYRPSQNKIIEVANITINSSTAPQIQKETKLVRVVIYNGTLIAGLARSIEKKLTENMKNIIVVSKENATNDYKKTLVIDIKNTKKDIVTEIAKIASGEASILPEGEKKPDADILIIAGE